MINIGSHLSIAKGYYKAAQVATDIGANTFQFFTRNPRGGSVKKLDMEDISAFSTHITRHQFAPILAHAPYTMNLCAEKTTTAEFAESVFVEDLERLEKTPCSLYNFHPGSHTGQGEAVAIKKVVEVLSKHNTGQWQSKILLETMSGKGTEIGYTFEQLKSIIDGVDYNDNIGVCMDTCHIYSAGYDIVTDLEGVLEKFDNIIGLDRLYAIHLNDSLTPFASRKDRHAEIGMGTIGMAAILAFISHPAITNLPILLETPLDNMGHKREIAMILEALNG